MRKVLSIAVALLLLSSGWAYGQTSASSAGGGSAPAVGKRLIACVPPVLPVTRDILLVQTNYPWDSDADMRVLDLIGKSYDCVTSLTDIAALGAAVFSYKVILIVNDQSQPFYDAYASARSAIETYVSNGGTLVFFAGYAGWHLGQLNDFLPGGQIRVPTITEAGGFNFFYDQANLIADPTHPIVLGTTPGGDGLVIDNTMMAGNYTSHGWFDIPAGVPVTTIFTTMNITPVKPTFIIYSLGAGTVIATTNTWEFSYERGVASCLVPGGGCVGLWSVRALDDVFRYAFTKGGILGCEIAQASFSPTKPRPGQTVSFSATTSPGCANVWVFANLAIPIDVLQNERAADLADRSFFAMELTPNVAGTTWTGSVTVPAGFPEWVFNINMAGVDKTTGAISSVWPWLHVAP